MAPGIVGKGQYFLAGDYLAAMRDFALSKGISAERLLRGSELPMDVLLDPPARIGDQSVHQVGRNLVESLDDPMAAAIEYGERITFNRHGLLGMAIQGSSNLMEACDLLVQYTETRSSFKEFKKIPDDEYLVIRVIPKEINGESPAENIRLFFDLAVLINIDSCGRQLLSVDPKDNKTIIHVDQPEPENFPYELIENRITICFNQPYFELRVPLDWMKIPLAEGDAVLAKLAANQCESELQALHDKDLIREVRNRIHLAEDVKPTIDEMAAQLYMSTSTLQRRLKDQNTTYQKLKAEVRMEEAQTLLKNNRFTLEFISQKLGFSNASNFNKSFKSWAGKSPQQYRKEHFGL